MRDKLQTKLCPFAQEILQIAACLGWAFDERIIVLVAKSAQKRKAQRGVDVALVDGDCSLSEGKSQPPLQESHSDAVACCLGARADEGLLGRANAAVELGALAECKLAHNQIQLAACSLAPEQEPDLLKLLIGQTLVESLMPGQLKKVMFVAVSLLSQGLGCLALDATQEPELIS